MLVDGKAAHHGLNPSFVHDRVGHLVVDREAVEVPGLRPRLNFILTAHLLGYNTVRLLEFPQNFVNLVLVKLREPAESGVKEGVSDELHLTEMLFIVRPVLQTFRLHFIVNFLQHVADSSHCDRRVLLAADSVLAHCVVEQGEGLVDELLG